MERVVLAPHIDGCIKGIMIRDSVAPSTKAIFSSNNRSNNGTLRTVLFTTHKLHAHNRPANARVKKVTHQTIADDAALDKNLDNRCVFFEGWVLFKLDGSYGKSG